MTNTEEELKRHIRFYEAEQPGLVCTDRDAHLKRLKTLQAVLELHKLRDYQFFNSRFEKQHEICGFCSDEQQQPVEFPCLTRKLIEGME